MSYKSRVVSPAVHPAAEYNRCLKVTVLLASGPLCTGTSCLRRSASQQSPLNHLNAFAMIFFYAMTLHVRSSYLLVIKLPNFSFAINFYFLSFGLAPRMKTRVIVQQDVIMGLIKID